MVPQTLLNVLQTGGKYFLDLDPTITEHLARHIPIQIASTSQSTITALLQLGSRCAAGLTPVFEGLRGIKLHFTQT